MISGTSHDGIDVAVVDFASVNPVGQLEAEVLHLSSPGYPPELRARLAAALPPAQTTLAEICELDTLIGQAFADAADAALRQSGPVDLVVSHGQTVYHWVRDDHALGTLQIGQPAWIAEKTGSPVLSDVRIRDITAGGHGAPLVSVMDALLLAALPGRTAALNLGGIANMTVVRSATDVVAYDIGPANALIDAVMVASGANDLGFDADGEVARRGAVHAGLLAGLLADPYFSLPTPKSTGKEHFHGRYVEEALARLDLSLSTEDLVATLTAFTAQSVARDVRAAAVDTLLVSGGGYRNPVLMEQLRAGLPGVRVVPSDELGASTDGKEAIAFALIGWLSWHGLPGALPSGTGAREPRILGTLTPGAGPLRLPEPLTQAPEGLVLHSSVAG
ncbi:anhydro-N-acetylmuramic acid kinase [Psychromicrobium xiongbiense]|uniref:anhydro-N-acetylmuramic acid kinase n=1 Tax=Psychromicrobium xiongbiense TaxID=3051184 RepID=UPI00255418C6|nr:anhydro-N-acetylmuramic acid kinase [Psychromicrobium sp. YIM S02556]